jgi:hypothetical protein
VKTFLLLVVAALIAAVAVHALAQMRPEIRFAVLPIGTASSNGISFAWFYDSAERSVYVCRTGHAGGDTVECKAKAVLP